MHTLKEQQIQKETINLEIFSQQKDLQRFTKDFLKDLPFPLRKPSRILYRKTVFMNFLCMKLQNSIWSVWNIALGCLNSITQKTTVRVGEREHVSTSRNKQRKNCLSQREPEFINKLNCWGILPNKSLLESMTDSMIETFCHHFWILST